jgi:CO/xanthine dehydrogenase FAD-binding subunit
MLSPFDYFRPEDIDEALTILGHEREAVLLAGGTDLLVNMRRGKLRPQALVDIKGLEECQGIRWENGHLSVGSLTTFNQLLRSREIREHFPLLVDAARLMGCYEIRQRATIGGNVVNASPGAESGSPLAALDAQVVLRGPRGSRRMPVKDFWRGVGKTDLASGELLVRILLPRLPQGSRSAYLRRSRVQGMDLASVNVAVVVINPQRPQSREIRIAMGAVAPTPVRAGEIETLLQGQELTPQLLARMREKIQEGLAPRATSLRATPAYKKEMIGILTEMALEGLLAG